MKHSKRSKILTVAKITEMRLAEISQTFVFVTNCTPAFGLTANRKCREFFFVHE